jgi:hypothetical protein
MRRTPAALRSEARSKARPGLSREERRDFAATRLSKHALPSSATIMYSTSRVATRGRARYD